MLLPYPRRFTRERSVDGRVALLLVADRLPKLESEVRVAVFGSRLGRSVGLGRLTRVRVVRLSAGAFSPFNSNTSSSVKCRH